MIRAGTPEDLPRLREIARAAYAEYVPLIGAEPPPMLQEFERDLAEGALWVIGDPAEGYVVARPQGADWLLENVAVAPEAQGKGIGKRLIVFAEAEGARRSFAKVVLYTNVHMVANLTMYPAMGYQEIARRTEKGVNRVYFEKSLGGRGAVR